MGSFASKKGGKRGKGEGGKGGGGEVREDPCKVYCLGFLV